MANVGKLVVELAASTAQFQADMGKAVRITEQSSKRMGEAIGTLKGLLGGLGGGITIAGIAAIAQQVISATEALGDLADATGSSVEDLSRLSNQAKIAGAQFEDIEGALLKFTAKLGETKKDSDEFVQALKALGVTSKDPATALQQVITGFDKFANSATKAAYAKALFDKTGPKFLQTLSDMARLGDVAATTTTKQAEEAEKFEQSLRRLSVEATGFRNALLQFVIPGLTDTMIAFNNARAAGLGFFATLLGPVSQEGAQEKLDAWTEKLRQLRGELERAQSLPLGLSRIASKAAQDRIKDAEEKVAQYTRLRNLYISQQPFVGPEQPRKELPPFKATGGGGKERIDEAQRYLESLQKQLDKTQELGEVELVLKEIATGRLKGATEAQKQEAVYLAESIDRFKELRVEQEASKKLQEEEARIRERSSQIALRSLQTATGEADNLAEQNQAMREETELIGKDAKSIYELTQRRLDDAIATREQTLAARVNITGMDAEAQEMERSINLLKQRKGLLADRAFAEQMAENARQAKEFNDIFVNSFADGLASVVDGTRSVSDAFKDMERNIVASISRIAAQKIAESIFGAPTSSGGGGIFGSIGNFFGSLFGGSNIGALGAFATGTSFAPGGLALVGERGPELVNLPRGAQVIPNDVLQSRRESKQANNVTIHINVPPGTSRQTADQIAVRTGLAVQRAMVRNT